MLNRVVLCGRLVKEVELRFTSSGKAVASGTIAVTRQFNREETDFINLVIWGKPAENTANFTQKGSLVGVDGRIQVRTYEKDGKNVYVTEVVAESVQFLDPKKKDTPNKPPQSDDRDPFAQDGQPIDISDDDLPF